VQPQARAAALARRRTAAAAESEAAPAWAADARAPGRRSSRSGVGDRLCLRPHRRRPPLKILTVTDEHTREALATPVARRLGADETVNTLEQIVERRGRAPAVIRCDNGPEFISQALRDWCRFNESKPGYIEPGAPWQNPFVESFNGHLRRELLDLESFNTLFEAQLLLDDWRLQYNHYRPHQSLNYMTPAEYARQQRTDSQPELS
jgi:putative transposase